MVSKRTITNYMASPSTGFHLFQKPTPASVLIPNVLYLPNLSALSGEFQSHGTRKWAQGLRAYSCILFRMSFQTAAQKCCQEHLGLIPWQLKFCNVWIFWRMLRSSFQKRSVFVIIHCVLCSICHRNKELTVECTSIYI